MRRLAVIEDPAGQQPVIPVVRLDQQDLARRVGEERGRRGEHGGQLREPCGLRLAGNCLLAAAWSSAGVLRAASGTTRPYPAPPIRGMPAVVA